jgi:hypothetical protein
MDWLNVAAGVVTVITGVITIVHAFKPKPDKASASTKTKKEKNTGVNSGTAQKAKINPTPAVAGVQEFSSNDKAYQEWVTKHPQGFVINTNQGVSPEYMALHKATCGHVSNFDNREQGAFTERGYMKVCSTEIDQLREWAKVHGRTDGSFTGNCKCASS